MRPATGDFWVVEHGPQGGDELNRPQRGLNYGWPVISYGETYQGNPIGEGISEKSGMEQPVYYWDPVIAPGGMVFYEGDLYADWQDDILIASLVPGGLVRLDMLDNVVVGEERLIRDMGRVRNVAVDADGAILAITDKKNGALIRLTPSPASASN